MAWFRSRPVRVEAFEVESDWVVEEVLPGGSVVFSPNRGLIPERVRDWVRSFLVRGGRLGGAQLLLVTGHALRIGDFVVVDGEGRLSVYNNAEFWKHFEADLAAGLGE